MAAPAGAAVTAAREGAELPSGNLLCNSIDAGVAETARSSRISGLTWEFVAASVLVALY